MTLRRFPASFRSFLLVFSCFVIGLPPIGFADEAITEAAPAGVKIDADNQDEPSIDFEDHSDVPVRTVSRMRRKPSKDSLIELCKETVEVTSRRMLSTNQHTPWQMIHALLGLRNDFSLLHNGAPINGLDWIAEGQTYENEYWFEKTRHGGRAHPFSRPYAFEGHANQTIALISMCGVDLNRQFGTANGSVTMREMIQHAQMTVSRKDEPTWTLWVLSRYLPTSARWKNEKGEYWSIERLVQEEVAKPERGAPCGGTHGLFALAHARNVYQQQGKPLRGVWLQAEYKIRKYINTARFQRNSDGSLSSNYFRGREYNPDFNKRMASVGHVLEFLMIALPQRELNSQWVRQAIHSAATELMNNRKAYVKCSPLYHTVNALNIYLDRVNPAVPTEIALEEERITVEVEKAPSSKVPVKTVSRPKPVPEEAETMIDGERTLPPVTDDADSAKLPVVTPKVEGTNTLRPENTQPKPMPTESSPKTESGDWKATAPERRVPVSATPELQVGGASPGTADVKHETPEAVERVEPLSTPAESGTAVEPVEPEDALAPPIVSEPLTIPSELPMPESTEETATVELPEGDSTVKDAEVSESVETPTTEAAASAEPKTVEVAELSVGGLEIPDLTEPSMANVVEEVEVVAIRESDTATTQELLADEVAEQQPSDGGGVSSTDAIVAAIGLKKGMVVADVGSGAGTLLGPIAKAVGSNGQVYAIESSAQLVERLDNRVATEELANVQVVRNDSQSLQLMFKRVNAVIVADAYERLEDPAAIIDSIKKALLPGGDLIIINSRETTNDSDRVSLINKMKDAGLDFVDDVDVPAVETGTYLRFKRPF